MGHWVAKAMRQDLMMSEFLAMNHRELFQVYRRHFKRYRAFCCGQHLFIWGDKHVVSMNLNHINEGIQLLP